MRAPGGTEVSHQFKKKIMKTNVVVKDTYCPKCEGKGWVFLPFYAYRICSEYDNTTKCPKCGGTGLRENDNKKKEEDCPF